MLGTLARHWWWVRAEGAMYADFDWHEAPLNGGFVCPIACVIYLIVVAVLSRLVPSGGFQCINRVLLFHNVLLSLLSLIIFLGCTYEMYARWQVESSYEFIFCETPKR